MSEDDRLIQEAAAAALAELDGAAPEAAAGSPASEAAPPEGATAERLAAKEAAYAELESQYKRLAADFENARRRQAIERDNLIKMAAERLVTGLLDVVDNFERAVSASRTATEPQQVVAGLEMIQRQLLDFMSKEGVAPIPAEGARFDPNLHEAMMRQEVTDVPDETVIQVFRPGYTLHGRILRAAQVVIANNPAMPPVEAASAPEALSGPTAG